MEHYKENKAQRLSVKKFVYYRISRTFIDIPGIIIVQFSPDACKQKEKKRIRQQKRPQP